MSIQPDHQSRNAESPLKRFAVGLHAAETASIESVKTGGDATEIFARFCDAYLDKAAFKTPSQGALVDHALWRMLGVEQIRHAALNVIPFLEPYSYGVEQAQLVVIVGRFASSDPLVKTFLQEVVDGSAMGLIILNSLAVTHAGEKLTHRDHTAAAPPTQADDVALFVR